MWLGRTSGGSRKREQYGLKWTGDSQHRWSPSRQWTACAKLAQLRLSLQVAVTSTLAGFWLFEVFGVSGVVRGLGFCGFGTSGVSLASAAFSVPWPEPLSRSQSRPLKGGRSKGGRSKGSIHALAGGRQRLLVASPLSS
jgi:hypothetical protein